MDTELLPDLDLFLQKQRTVRTAASKAWLSQLEQECLDNTDILVFTSREVMNAIFYQGRGSIFACSFCKPW